MGQQHTDCVVAIPSAFPHALHVLDSLSTCMSLSDPRYTDDKGLNQYYMSLTSFDNCRVLAVSQMKHQAGPIQASHTCILIMPMQALDIQWPLLLNTRAPSRLQWARAMLADHLEGKSRFGVFEKCLIVG